LWYASEGKVHLVPLVRRVEPIMLRSPRAEEVALGLPDSPPADLAAPIPRGRSGSKPRQETWAGRSEISA